MPSPTKLKISSWGRRANPRSPKVRLTAVAISHLDSISVPSRSKISRSIGTLDRTFPEPLRTIVCSVSLLFLTLFVTSFYKGGLVNPHLRASCCLLVPLSIGRVPVLVQLRPSSEGLLRPRAPGAQDRHGRPSTSSRFASTGGSAWPPRPLLHLGPRLHVIQNGHQSDHLFVTGGQHHPLRLDPHELGRLEIGDDHDATTDEVLGLVFVADPGHDLKLLAAQVHPELQQLLR